MKVPQYERRVGPASMPSPDVNTRVSPDAFGAGLAEKLGELGNTAQRAGALLGQVALKQQEEINAMDFALLKAKADSWWAEQLEVESMNTDYEGQNERLATGWEAFRKELGEGVRNEDLRRKAEQFFEIKSLSMQGDMQGLFLKKQATVRKAKFDEAVGAATRAGDRATLEATFEAAKSWLPETEIVKEREKAYTDMQYNEAVAQITKDPLKWEPDRKALDRLDEVTIQRLLDFRDRKQNEIREKVSDWVALQCLSGKYPSRSELLSLTEKGMLDPQRANSWANAIEARQEMLANRAERAAAAAERREARAFRQRLRSAPPDEKELLLLDYNYGTTPEQSKAAFETLRKGIHDGTKDGYDVMDANGAGLIGERQRNRLMKELQEVTGRQNRNYTKAKNLARGELQGILQGIGVDPYNYLLEFDEAADPTLTPLERIRDVRSYLVRKAINDNPEGALKSLWPWTDKKKVLEKIGGAVWFPQELGGVSADRLSAPNEPPKGPDKSSTATPPKRAGTPSLEDILNGNY